MNLINGSRPARAPAPRRLRPACAAAAALLVLLLVPLRAAAANFLWKATGKSGTIYLAGSVHMLNAAYYPLDPAFERAFNDSDLLVEEVDLDQLLAPDMQLSILMRSRLPEGQTLQSLLSPGTLARLRTFTADLGPAADALNRFKPWMLATIIEGLELQKAGFDPNLGLDKHFFDRARADGKMVKALETAEDQIALFDGLPMEQQDRFLAETLEQLATEKANVTRLADAWRSGDAETVAGIVLSDMKDDEALYQRLLVARNRNWLPQIEALLERPGRAFIVVGAAHLVGPDGLLALLAARGYAVAQM
ncbi:MAG: TraB/GumN family protein [Acidobacteria bacterium]|nr:TraB/GumN family protein [Acidobacteriota bacterium]